jgi:hypothetical protein
MSERDVVVMLSESNPVQVVDLASLDPPSFGHRPPRRRLVLVAAVLAAVAASLIGLFAFSDSSIHRPPSGGLQLLPPPTLAHPLPTGGKETSLPEAAKALGAPIVLPNSSLAAPPDVGAVWAGSFSEGKSAAVTFPAAGLIVLYWHPALYANPGSVFTAVADGKAGFHVLDLKGVAALAIDQNSDSTGTNFGSIEFDASGTTILVLGHYGQQTLQAVAQSIVDQSPPARPETWLSAAGGRPTMARPFPPALHATRTSLAGARAALGVPIVLPNTKLVAPSDSGTVWIDGSPGEARAVVVTFPAKGVFVMYIHPAPSSGTAAHFRSIAEGKGMRATVITLGGRTPALAIRHNPGGKNIPVIIFNLGASEIRVFGQHDQATLRALAQSIVDRSK